VPSRDEHLDQARHNSTFYAAIDKSTYKDWAATILFYTGLHYLDAVLADRENKHPLNHPTRDRAVFDSAELKPVYGHYSALKNASYNARYKPRTLFTIGQINQLETTHLATIRNRVGQYVTI